MRMKNGLSETMDNAYLINPKKGLWGSRLSILCLLGDQFFFEDVEKKVELKSPKLHARR